MSIITLDFLLFVFAIIILYYLIPKRFQWWVLLTASLLFYALSDSLNIFFIILTSLSVFYAAILIEKIGEQQKLYIKENKATLSKEEKDKYKRYCLTKKRRILIGTLIINVGVLCLFKYLHFAIERINLLCSIWGSSGIKDNTNLIAPLGISFYTLQSIGYLVDVYWGKIKTQRNYGKLLLFTSFFPQIIQGPISSYADLSSELFNPHSFKYKNFSWGFWRIVWGLFKKMVIANAIAPYCSAVLSDYSVYSGFVVFIGIILHTVQLYADFSGYMDIACGVSEMLGIRLTENFNRPFFSKSIAEFWRRWHISLGVWFKNYIFFPIAVSKWNTKLSSAVQKKFGKFAGQSIMITMPLVAVWLITGLWHGASTAYIVWGALNGLIIITSLWLKPTYDKYKNTLHINENSKVWRVFQITRTSLIFAFIEVLPEMPTLSQGFDVWRHAFSGFPKSFSISQFLPDADPTTKAFFVFSLLGVIAMFVISLLQRKKQVREYISVLPYAVRMLILLGMFIIVASIGVLNSLGGGGFMYANF